MAAIAVLVEVLVVGIGFLTGLGILAAAFADPDTSRQLAPAAAPLAADAVLTFAYALGILIDRVADTAIAPVRRGLRTQPFPTATAHDQARLRLAEIPASAGCIASLSAAAPSPAGSKTC